MSSNTIICMVVVGLLCAADLAARYYLAKKKNEDADVEPVSALQDFLETIIKIASECIEIADIDTADEHYKEKLAKEILDEFMNDLDKFFAGTPTQIAIKSLPENFLLDFIIRNVINLPEIVSKIKNTTHTKTVDMTKYINDEN